jgi:hypothetical protein
MFCDVEAVAHYTTRNPVLNKATKNLLDQRDPLHKQRNKES